MQRTQIVLVLLSLAAPAMSQSGDPLAKTYELLDSLAAKITAEGEVEAKAFKEYVEWCDNAAADLRYEIQTGESKQSELEASIGECKADISACNQKIEDLSASISADEKELTAATQVRDKEHKTFLTSEAELVDAIDTLDRATAILQKEMAKNPAALVQVDVTNLNSVISALGVVINAASFSSNDQSKLMALVQQKSSSDDEDLQEPGAPASAVYKTHSTSIFDVLEDMKEKAESQLADLRKAERTAQHNFDMLKQSLEDEIEADNKDMDEEKSLKAATEEKQANAEGDLAETVSELNQDKDSLKTATTTCMQVAADHDATVRSRTEELNAIATAKKILKETTGGAQDQTYSFLQTQSKATLQSRTDLKNAEVLNIVKKLAREHHSSALAQLASRIKAVMAYGSAGQDDVFGKVKGLIQEMLAKLEAQAQADATEKAYCDDEMSKTEEKKAERDAVIARLTSKIDLASAKSAELKAEVKVLQAELATLAKQQAEMDSIRAEEKAAYDTAKSELELGIAGVQKALGVLRDYYGGAAFVQKGFDAFMQQPAKPKTFVKAEGAGQSIVDILEVVESDFTKNLAAEETQEEDAVATYEKTTQDNKVSTTKKSQGVKYKTQEFTGLDKSIADMSGDRDSTQTELNAILEYYGKLKERCIAKPETYADRKARREAEIQGLKEALQILETETAFLQRRGGRKQRFIGL